MSVRDDLTELGYDVGVAWGDATVESDALDEARELAAPERVQTDAEPLIADAVAQFVMLTADAPGIGPSEIADFMARVTAQTFRQIAQARDARVELYERSLEIAEEMPTVYRVSGYGLDLYTPLDEEHVEREEGGRPTDDGGVVHPLVASHKARRFVHVLGQTEPENVGRAETAMGTLRGKGYRLDCDLEDDGSGFSVGILASGAVIEIATDVTELEGFADTLPDVE